jgi:hypothetical protein
LRGAEEVPPLLDVAVIEQPRWIYGKIFDSRATMRFAAVADVHGNFMAHEAVLADISAAGRYRDRKPR